MERLNVGCSLVGETKPLDPTGGQPQQCLAEPNDRECGVLLQVVSTVRRWLAVQDGPAGAAGVPPDETDVAIAADPVAPAIAT
jgi:hypothetical protein